MNSQTSKMIYQEQHVAALIAGKMCQTNGGKWDVVKLPHGFQVVGVKKCPPYMPPAVPHPVKKPEPIVAQPGKTWAGVEFVTLEFKGLYPKGGTSCVSPKYVNVITADGKPTSFGKTTILGWEEQPGKVLVKIAKSLAIKKGLL